MNSFTTRSLCAICALASAHFAMARPPATFQTLGFLAGRAVHTSVAHGVSRNGQFVCGESGGEAFIWTSGGGMVALGFLQGAQTSVAKAVSNTGVVTGSSGGQAFIWSVGTGMLPLGFLQGASDSEGEAISNDGTAIAGNSGQAPFRWTFATGMVALAIPLTGEAHAISADGTVVAGSTFNLPGYWTVSNGYWLAYGSNLDFSNGVVDAIAPDNSAAGGSANFPDTQEVRNHSAYRYKAGTFDSQLHMGEVLGISGDGDIAVGDSAFGTEIPANSASIWVKGGEPQALQGYLSSRGATSANSWNLTVASAISDDGTVIVGTAHSNNVDRAFVATIPLPSPAQDPEVEFLTIAPSPRVGGNQVSITVQLNQRPTNNFCVALTAIGGNLTVVPNVLLGNFQGIRFVDNQLIGVDVANSKGVWLSGNGYVASYADGLTKWDHVFLMPAQIYTPTLSGNSVRGGANVTCTVKLNGQAPLAEFGSPVSITSSNPSVASVPPNANFTDYATNLSFLVFTRPVAQQTQVTITISYLNSTRSVNLTVNP